MSLLSEMFCENKACYSDCLLYPEWCYRNSPLYCLKLLISVIISYATDIVGLGSVVTYHNFAKLVIRARVWSVCFQSV